MQLSRQLCKAMRMLAVAVTVAVIGGSVAPLLKAPSR